MSSYAAEVVGGCISFSFSSLFFVLVLFLLSSRLITTDQSMVCMYVSIYNAFSFSHPHFCFGDERAKDGNGGATPCVLCTACCFFVFCFAFAVLWWLCKVSVLFSAS